MLISIGTAFGSACKAYKIALAAVSGLSIFFPKRRIGSTKVEYGEFDAKAL
jgi:hypothetical protein